MNLFKVQFYQGNTDAEDYNDLLHEIADSSSERIFHNVTISGEKLQSSGNYAREPRRVQLTLFADDWIKTNILAGNNEFERYISYYKVKLCRDEVLIFTGIIDTSFISYNQANEEIKISCYDNLRLLAKYNDLKRLYTISAGYAPYLVLAYMCDDIEAAIPISVPSSFAASFAKPVTAITEANAISLVNLNYSEVVTLPVDVEGLTYSWHTFGDGVVHGFKVFAMSNTISFCVTIQNCVKGTTSLSERYQGRFYAHVYKYFNKMAVVASEYYEETQWLTSAELGELTTQAAALTSWLAAQGIVPGDLETEETLNDAEYKSVDTSGSNVEAFIYGDIIPPTLHLGKFYESGTDDDNPTNLKALQAMLLIYNATLHAYPNGTIYLVPKEGFTGSATVISNADIISMESSRVTQDNPDMSALDVLAGNTALMQSTYSNMLKSYYSSLWQANVVIDKLSSYTFSLGQIITINDTNYAISEIDPDMVNDEYHLKVWKI